MGDRNSESEALEAREREIRAATIGEPTILTGKIPLVEYDPSWPELFEREAEGVRSALGEKVLLLEHAGSTSVPGLPAKPIIDMILAVKDSADESAYAPAMERAGYVLRIREPHWFEHRVFKGPRVDINLHVFTVGCEEIDRMLRFRDRLRADGADRELYARTKRELARRDWKFVQHYADAKTEVVKSILARGL